MQRFAKLVQKETVSSLAPCNSFGDGATANSRTQTTGTDRSYTIGTKEGASSWVHITGCYYFPGVYTAILPMIPGIYGIRKLVTAARAATHIKE
jgi:hypothetical protein